MQHTRIYRAGKIIADGCDPDLISDYLEETDTVAWLDLSDPTHDEIALIGEEFGLHDLVLEDIRNGRQRAKLETYGDHIFISLYAIDLVGPTAELKTHEISALFSDRFLITVHPVGFEMSHVVKHLDADPRHAASGVAYLLHGLLDHVVDDYFAAVQVLDEGIETLEDVIFDGETLGTAIQKDSFAMRKALVGLRRVVLPVREVINALLRRDNDVIDDAMVPYYQDVYDHVLRASEWTDSLRDLVSNILETNLTIQGNRLNEIMKRLTSWAAIIAVPTAVTGFFGQNVPYPGFGTHVGFLISVAVILGGAGVLYVAFKKQDWL